MLKCWVNSSWFNDPKYGEEYRNILNEQENNTFID